MTCKASEVSGAFCMADRPQAVVFDIGRVLYDWNLRYLFEKLIPDREELDWFLANVVTEEWHFQTDAGRPLDEMVAKLKAQFPLQAALIEAYRNRFEETIPHAVPGTHAIVHQLAARDVPLYALTNFGAEFWARSRPQWPIFDLFADVVVSGDERIAKPDPAIFAIAERRFGHAPGELFFTDDNPANVAAARARGWHAHLFEDAGGLEAELVSAGLLG